MKQFYARITLPFIIFLLTGLTAFGQTEFSILDVKHACNGLQNGSLSVVVTAGNPTFTIQVIGPTSKSEMGAELNQVYQFSDLKNGSYIIVVQDVNGEPTSQSTTIRTVTGLSIQDFELTHNTCSGSADGSISLTVSGGTGAYRFSLDGGSTFITNPITNLAGGTYTVDVFDENTVCSATGTYTIFDELTLNTDDVSLCLSDPAYILTNAVSANVNGGTYTFTGPGVSGDQFSPVAAGAGLHTIGVSYEVNGCVQTAEIMINVTSSAVVEAGLSHVSCFGGSDGSISLNISGGTAPYDIRWNHGPTTAEISNLTAGTYSVIVTDDNGCPAEHTYTITEPAALSFTTAAVSNITCNGAANGSIDIEVGGGTAPYTYEWSTNATSQDLPDLDVGTYTVTVTDSKDCQISRTFDVTEPALLQAAAVIAEQIRCFGETNGAIDLTVSGGTAPYTFDWGGGITVEDPTGLPAGEYTVIVTDDNNCTASTTVTLVAPSALAAEFTVTDATTCGGNEGAIDLTVSGGTAPFTYQWTNGGQTTEDISGLTAGNYTVIIRDANNCELEASATVAQPAGISGLEASLTPVNCFGESNGAIDLRVIGGTAPYTYEWESGQATENLSDLAAGSYTVTVTDATNCKITESFTITEPTQLQLSGVPTHVACAGSASGAIDLTVSGGTGSYTYAWSNGETTEDIAGLIAGNYTIYIEDENGCSVTAEFTINDGVNLALAETISPVSCHDGNNGAIEVVISGGTAPYTYTWSNGGNTASITELVAGEYTVTVEDANACTITANYTVAEPDALVLTLVAEDATTCGGSEGSITLTVEGGTGTYTYQWSNSETTKDISGLSADTYEVIVTDANNCTARAAVTINQPAGISSLTAAPTNISCNGLTDGSINLTVNGGVAPFTYAWSNGASTEDISGLSAGTYQVTVTDANGCSLVTEAVISEPAVLAITATQTNLLCASDNNGQIDITVTGGTGTYTYEWSNEATTQDINDLSAGTYTILIRDEKGCTATEAFTITAPDALTASAEASAVSCNGLSDGSVTLTVAGGTAGYTYLWSNDATTQNLENVAAGTYSVIITDANGCTTTATAVVDEPAALTASITGTSQLCTGANNGSLTATPAGGTAPYTYLWGNGETTATLQDLAAGDYSVTITDAKGCIASAEFTITEQSLSVNLGDDKTVCASTMLDAGYTTDNYSIVWSTGETTATITGSATGTYWVRVTDNATGCDGYDEISITVDERVTAEVSLATAESITCHTTSVEMVATASNAGAYAWYLNGVLIEGAADDKYTLTSFNDGDIVRVVVTPAESCNAGPAEASFELNKKEVITLEASLEHITCFGEEDGTITLNVSGGSGIYTYEWSNGATTKDLENLAAGDYAVIVKDNEGCEVAAVYTITAPAALSATTAVTPLSSCTVNDAAIELTVSGGTAPYTFAWEHGATTEDLSELAAGVYSVIITDAKGCTTTATATIDPLVDINITATATDVSSCTQSNGRIDISVEGGEAPYTYSWSNGATTENLENVAAGTYILTVTDTNGCTATASATVGSPDGISELTAAITHVDCFGNATGAIDLSVIGGQAPYSFSWSNEVTLEDLTGLTAGVYSLTVTDANGCMITGSFEILAPAVLELAADVQNTTACGAGDGAISVALRGGTAPYAYSWSTGATGESIANLAPGTYSLTVTDAAGCTLTREYSISDPAGPEVTAIVQNISCSAEDLGSIDINVTGGTAPYTYNWSNEAVSEDISNLAAGDYSVIVTDNNGCSTNMRYTIEQTTSPVVTAQATAASCQAAADGSIEVTVDGGVGPYQFQWKKDGVAITADTDGLTGQSAGTYEVTVTDANGCSTTVEAVITEPAALQAAIEGTSRLCAGASNGSLEVAVNGGTAAYTYLWSNGETTASIQNLTAGDYSVTVTDANSCTITARYTIEEETLTVSLGDDKAVCKLPEGETEVLLNAGYDNANYSIRWFIRDGDTETTVWELPEYTVTTTGTYWVEVTDLTTGCSGTDAILVEIESSFVPTVSISPVNEAGVATEEINCNRIVLGAFADYEGDEPSYQWYRNGDIIGDATGELYEVTTFNNGDNFLVEVSSSLSCAEPAVVYGEYQLIVPTVAAPQFSQEVAEVCQGGDMPVITEVTGGTMRWFYDAANPTNPRIDGQLEVYKGTSFAPSAADYGVGTHIFFVTQTTVHCGESMDWATFTLIMEEEACEVPVCEVNPTVVARIQPGSEICPDIRTLNLVADTTDIGENPLFAWYYNGTLFSNDAAPSYTTTEGFSHGDEFEVVITITDERFICNDINTVNSIATISLVEELQATAQIQPIDAVCAESNTPVILTATGTYIDWRAEGLGTVYTWFINDEQVKQETLEGSSSTAHQLEVIPSELSADAVIRLQVGLPAEISCVLAPAEVTYAVPFAEPSAPTVTLRSNAAGGVCPGASVTFTATASANAGTSLRYIFSMDGAEVQAGTSNNFVLNEPQNGQEVQVKLEVTDATGLCLSATEATSEPLTVRVLTSEECVGNGFNCGVFGAELSRLVRPSCDERNGALYYQISGGTQPYFVRYTYAGEQVEQSINASSFELAMESLPAGEVSIYISDRNGNECSLTTILEAEPQLQITFEKATDGDVQCYGEASGKARLTVEGGNAPYEYMLEGSDTWQPLNGNAMEFDNLPAGIVNILVRNSATDACPAVASLEILNLYEEIVAVTSITQEANCNDNVGAFTLNNISGGNAALGYRVKLANEDNWRTYNPGMQFSGLARGRHLLMIENGSCQKTTPVVVPSPGLIALSEASRAITFTCENPELRNGLYLRIDTEITEVSGPYVADFYMMNGEGTYDLIATEELFNSSGELYKFYLEQGYYRVEVRSQTREGCPEVREFVIEGSEIPVPITFTSAPMNIYCEAAEGGVLITELSGAAGLPYQVEVYQEGVLQISRTISTFEYATQQQWEVSGLAEGLYQVIIKQDQGLCNTVEQSQPAQVVVMETDQKLNVSLQGTTVSLPERATGSLSFRVATGSGTAPYEANLVWVDRLEGQEDWMFESYGDQVLKNGTTGKYDFTYNNLPPGIYELTVTDANGCSVTLTDTVGYDTSVFVPNFISPNGDGKNDLFHIRNKMPNTQLIITNRWGKVVYQSQDYQNDWGGDALPEGLYYYSIKFPESENGELKGWLQIKRGAQPY